MLAYYPRKCTGKFPKWQRLYSMECRIIKKLSDVSYIVYDVCGKRNRIVHVDKLKLLSSCADNDVNETVSTNNVDDVNVKC